jgi:glycosyltransferase involved in cell wall biosynthesis
MKILHITPHLGGGVGRVLSQVANYHRAHNTDIEEEFICLEAPEKLQFIQAIEKCSVKVTIEPKFSAVQNKIAKADIVQLEWWQHPLMAKWLHAASGMNCRLAVWSHTSGLHYPVFPKGFPELPQAFMATTVASGVGTVVPSSGGFNDISARKEWNYNAPRYGHIGSLNEAKLHPRIMEFLAAANIHVQFYGDSEVGTPLRETSKIKLMGYTDNAAAALSKMEVFVYLLNPLHYGTTENALLEAMAAGVVPIVMNNKVEMSIVRHSETGLVVDSPASFAAAIRMLEKNPKLRVRMGKAAAADIRQRFSLETTAHDLRTQYDKLIKQPKKTFDFKTVLGETPFDWFMAGLGAYAPLFAPGAEDSKRKERHALPFLYEKNKSSLAHFLRYFSEDAKLRYWQGVLDHDLTQQRKNA